MKYPFIILFLSISIQAQKKSPGTVYLSDGRILNGLVEFSTVAAGIQKKNPRVFYWEKEDAKKKQTFRSVKVDSVSLNNEVTIYSIPVDKKCKKLFFRVLINGKFPLVFFNMVHIGGPLSGVSGGRASEYWIWKKEMNKAFPMKTTYSDHSIKSYKGKARDYMYECPSLAKDYSNKEFRKMDAIELYRLYNDCVK
ncbi:hypothetical protein [Flagellimonas sp. W118]|uniref:hypothetical protein n=1 Tax=Flagellimonas sp. W118 TaxID=3410791 RepID=UPI003BF60371